MRRHTNLAATLAVAIIFVTGSALAGKATLGKIAPPGGASGTVIIPDQFLRSWDPVTVFFASDTGPSSGPEDHPARYVKVQPDHPGAYTWLDRRTLQFRPAIPWPPLAGYTWEAGGKPFRLVTLMAAPVSRDPEHGTTGLEKVETLTLTFAAPIDPEMLARMLTLELRPLPGVAETTARALTGRDFEMKAVERPSLNSHATYQVSLKEPVPPGMKVTCRLRLSLTDDPARSFYEWSFSTAQPFRVVAAGTWDYRLPMVPEGLRYSHDQALKGDERRSVVVEFSIPPAEADVLAARNFVRFTPPVEDLSYRVNGNELVISGSFQWETIYSAVLSPVPLKSARGTLLEMTGESEFSFYFPALRKYFRLTSGQAILERDGPRMIPVEGRASDRADLRIYPLDPWDRSYWPFPKYPQGGNDSQPPGPGEIPTPFASSWHLKGSALEEYIKALDTPPYSRLVDLPLRAAGAAADFGLDLTGHFQFLSGKDAPGSYLVGLRELEEANFRSWMRVQVTDLALSTFEDPGAVLFVVNSLATGRPVSDAEILLEGTGSRQEWKVLAKVRTGPDGTILWKAPGESDSRVLRISVRKGDDYLVLNPEEPPEFFHDNHWTGSYDTWLQWAFERLEYRFPSPETLCHIFTERPVYRPEEQVHIKGYLRTRHEGAFSLVTDAATLIVNGPGALEWRYPVDLDAYGSFYHAFSEKDLPTGDYTATLQQGANSFGSVTFKVEAFRLPQFEVSLHAPDTVPLDAPFDVTLTARYYAGGNVAGQPVVWQATQFPYAWVPKGREGFFFSSDGRFSGLGRFPQQPRLSRSGETNDTGASSITLDPTTEADSRPRTYVVEATVTGADEMTVTSVKQVKALPPFVIGLKVPRYLEKAESITPELLVLGHDEEPVTGKEVTVRLLQRQWHSHLQASDFTSGTARYVTDVVDEKVAEQVVKSTEKPLAVAFPISGAGVYIVEAEAQDRLGRTQTISIDLFAGGETAVAWSRPTTNVFETTTDKPRYDPGETASIVLQSPFQEAMALAAVEAPDGYSYQWVEVKGGKGIFQVPIKKTFMPRLPVHFLLYRGRVPGTKPVPGSSLDLGKPATMAATIWIEVNPLDHKVLVSLKAPERALPGQEITVEIALKEAKGAPLPGQVTLWLVDQAVLALGKEQRLDPLPDFITQPATRLEVRDTRNLVTGYLAYAEKPGGDEGKMAMESLFEKTTIRKNFVSVPYYNPTIIVGADGKAKVTVRLPDNLTNFKLRAKAVSGPDRFGFGTGHLEVRLPLIVQPGLPRFVRPGDSFTAVAIGRVVEGEGGKGSAEFQAEGVTLTGPGKIPVEWVPNQPERLEFPVKVTVPPLDEQGEPTLTEAVFRAAVAREADGASDAFEVRVPFRPDRHPITERVLQELEAGKALEIPALPEPARSGTVHRSLLLSGQPALIKMAAGLDFYHTYPYGCAEQRLSGVSVRLALKKFREALHRPESAEDLAKAVRDTMEYLQSCVDGKGLVAYWPGSEGYVALTAWVYEFLVQAKNEGYAVDQKFLDTLSTSLTASLRSDYAHFIEGEDWAERCLALRALAANGTVDTAYAEELARKTQFLNLEADADILLAFAAAGTVPPALTQNLFQLLWKGVVIRLHQGRELFGGLQENFTARNGLILPSEERTLAKVVRTLHRFQGEDQRLQVLINGLVTLGKGDGWGSTNANAAALRTLAELLQPPFEGLKPQTVHLKGDGLEQDISFGAGQPTGYWAGDHSGTLEVAWKGGEGETVAAWAETRFTPAGDGSQAEAFAKGFVITRELRRFDANGTLTKKEALTEKGTALGFRIGDLMEEHVQVVNPKDRHFVAVTAPIAAGMEPLNPRLATAPPEAKPSEKLTLEPTYAAYLDDQVAWYYDTLPKGTYDFFFRVRATVPGTFTEPPALAEMMYDGAVQGGSYGVKVEIGERE